MKNAFVIIFSLLVFPLISQNKKAEVNWISMEEAFKLNQTKQKPILVDVYTNWCGWCKRMDKGVYSNTTIVNYINANFYAVKFNAEQKQDITIADKTYKFKNEGRRGYHELAAILMNGRMSYPTTVFLDKSFKIIQPIPGYKQSKEMEPILHFFASEAYKNTKWAEYSKNFKSELK